jgi:hypothetical protein
MSHGHLMKTTGRPAEAVDSYRKALAIDPGFGEAWWSLANLKTFRLSEEDIARLEAALADPDLHDKARLHLHFALGKALEDAGRAEAAFGHYAQGNRLRAAMLDYSADEVTREVEESTALFTAAFYAQRSGWGAEAADPLFILGMPRAGSTLIEQILASHSMVEGTSELPYIPTLAREMVAQHPKYDGLAYPALLARLDARETRWLGEEYLRRASAHRTTDKPFFIDKLPNNWRDIGFIRLILPRARIVDARRHPLACGFSNFKQHFAEGQGFSYSLEDFGRYYRDYLRLMAHFEAVFPGEIVRMLNETLIEHSEPEIRRLLDRLGLPFDPACLRFWENDRAVRTPSAEQVRQPINREGMEQWKKFEPWLGPLKQALGPALEGWDSGV